MRRRARRWVVGLVVLAACTTRTPDRRPAADATAEPLAGGLAALAAGRWDEGTHFLEEAARRYPVVEDLTLYLRARAATSSADGKSALEHVEVLLGRYPDSVWAGPARLLAGQVRRRTGDLEGARSWLAAARSALPPGRARWMRATLLLAEVQHELGDDAAAIELATAVRQSQPRWPAARRARRLIDRIRAAQPALLEGAEARTSEAELRLREGNAPGARDEAGAALEALEAGAETADVRARALWVRAQAEHALRLAPAEATCLAIAAEAGGPLAPRALAAAASWRWNADDDARALELFRDVLRRFPASPQAPEALYGIGRVHQEAGRYQQAFEAYREAAARFPGAAVGAESRWRAGWVRYLAGDYAGAAAWFRSLAAETRKGARAAAEYWRARALERLGRAQASARFVHLADHHGTTYYGALAAERLGRAALPVDPRAISAPQLSFPSDLGGVHAERARVLADLGLVRFARPELDALHPAVSHRRLLEAYAAIRAPGAALRLALEIGSDTHSALRRYLYPLAYWDLVRSHAEASAVDPLLVEALIRQESLFEPEAVSPADAHGLMQLLPRTAREVAAGTGRPAPTRTGLHDAATNIGLGTLLLRRLLDRYGGSRVKALAAYNAGEDAVAKWEQRYAGRPEDEFVELISYRETRDYVKTVIRNYQVYRRLYTPSASVTSAGNPPNAPFDMTTSTSPGRTVATR